MSDRRFVWIAQVCDYESCGPLWIFDCEAKARSWLDRYQLKGDEQSKDIYREQVY